jgi:hypothetical protein
MSIVDSSAIQKLGGTQQDQETLVFFEQSLQNIWRALLRVKLLPNWQ